MSDIDRILRQIKPRVMSWISQGASAAAASAGGVKDHGALTGLLDDDHTQYVHINTARNIAAQHTFAPAAPAAPFTLNANAQDQLVTGLYADKLNKSVTAGAGLTGGGALTGSVTLDVGAGDGITVNADTVALTTPGTLSINSVNDAAGNHTHAISNSSNPGATRAILSSDVSGYLTLVRLNTDTLADKSGSSLTLVPTANVVLDPQTNYVLPYANYDVNLGAINKKYLTIHAAELWVETLVAQDTVATIGGRILVGPTTMLTFDLSSSQTNLLLNSGFETSGGGGDDVFADWTETKVDGTIAKDTSVYHLGAASCKLTEGASYLTRIEQTRNVTAGQGYTVTLWTRGDGTYAGRYYVWDNQHANMIVSWTSTGVTGTTWTKVVFSFVPPSGCTSVNIGVAGNGAVASINSWFDDVYCYCDSVIVKHNEMAANDICYMEAGGYIEFMKVLAGPSGSGPYTYYIQRDLDGTGVNDWYAGDAIFNTGTTNEGFLDLYSIHGVKSATQYGPSIVGNVRNSLVYNDWIEHWAIGNLNGVYGYGANTYGAAFGKYANGQSFITVDATNGIRIRNRSGSVDTTVSQWNLDGSIILGPDGSSYAKITGTELSFRNSSDNAIILIDSSAEKILCGLPATVKLNDAGIRLDTTGAGAGKFVLADELTTDDDGMLYMNAGYASTGEITAMMKMPAFPGSAGMFNRLEIFMGSVKGSGTTGAGIDLYAGYNSGSSYITITVDDTEMVKFTPTLARFGVAVTVKETSAPSTPASGYGIFYVDSGDSIPYFKSDGGVVRQLGHGPHTDYSSSSTVTGWSSFTTKKIYYTKFGSLMFVTFQISGTSNSYYARFTLPYSNNASVPQLFCCRKQDNGGTYGITVGTIAESSNEVRVYNDAGGGDFINSGTKEIIGQMWFRI